MVFNTECSVAPSCLTLWDSTACNLPASFVHGVFQAILEWFAISYSGDLINPAVEPTSFVSPALIGGFFTNCDNWEAFNVNFDVTALL